MSVYGLSPVNHLFNMAKQLYHRRSPALMPTLLAYKDQFPQMMRIAQGVQAVKIIIGHPPVMHQSSDKIRKRRILAQRFLATPTMTEIIGVQIRAQGMLPQPLAVDVHSGLVGMDHRTGA